MIVWVLSVHWLYNAPCADDPPGRASDGEGATHSAYASLTGAMEAASALAVNGMGEWEEFEGRWIAAVHGHAPCHSFEVSPLEVL